MSDAYHDWDASYLLGSLSPAERREYEAHLDECRDCSASVAELAVLPGLLSRVSARDVEQDVSQADLPVTILAGLVAARRRQRRHAQSLMIGFVVATAAAAVAATLIIPQLIPANPGQLIAEVTLRQVVASPLHADIRLVEHEWGTSIDMTCRYSAGSNGYGGGTAYGMYVTDAAGTATQISTWTAKPGSTVEPSGTTSLALADIRSVDVRAIDSGDVLLSGVP